MFFPLLLFHLPLKDAEISSTAFGTFPALLTTETTRFCRGTAGYIVSQNLRTEVYW